MNGITYLATPYTHTDHGVMLRRFYTVNAVAARMMAAGVHVFSPISHTHPIALAGELPRDWHYWQAYDRAMLRACDRLVVLCLDGWQVSVGVQAEIKIAMEYGLPVDYVTADYLKE